jgi:hypothetical protein
MGYLPAQNTSDLHLAMVLYPEANIDWTKK